MKRVVSCTTVNTTKTHRGVKNAPAFEHTCTLECGHIEVRTIAVYSAEPAMVKCSVCEKRPVTK